MVWPFSKNKPPANLPQKLIFKDGEGFLAYQCKYGFTEIKVRTGIVALVLDARQFGIQQAVKVEADGLQRVMLKVASEDGGFMVSAQTLNGKGDLLKPGDVVIWVPMEHIGDVVPKGIDKRFGWVGFIVAKIAPEIDTSNQNFNILSRYD